MNRELFGSYNVRGIYPKDINEEVVYKISWATAKIIKRGRMVVGHDARLSSPSLYRAALAALKKSGLKIRIIPAGLISTPMLYFLVNHLKAGGGINITASHNPKEYNGLKIVGKGAEPIHALEILKIIEKENG